jgi:hypothetical protein
VALLDATGMVDLATLPGGTASPPSSVRDRVGGRLKTERVSGSQGEATGPLTGRAQDHDRDLAPGALLVDRVFVVHLDQPWPQPLLLLGRSLAGDDRPALGSDLHGSCSDWTSGSGTSSASRPSPTRADDHQIGAVPQVKHRGRARPSCLTPEMVEQQHGAALTLPPSRPPVRRYTRTFKSTNVLTSLN